jgi:CRP/FNR family transcriptional regulator
MPVPSQAAAGSRPHDDAADSACRRSSSTWRSPRAVLCSTCHLSEVCVPFGLDPQDVQRLDSLPFARRHLGSGQDLFREGDPFRYLYAVRSGTFKSQVTLRDGSEQVTGFRMPGELLGLDGVASGRHASSASALEESEICAIPFASLSELACSSEPLRHVIARLMSREIVREHSLMMLLGSMNAEERLAAFLFNLSERMRARGGSPTELHLRMARGELGSLLGMKLETVSRCLSSFQEQGLLAIDRRRIRILDLAGLEQVFWRDVQ